MNSRSKYTPPTGQDRAAAHETDADVMADFFEAVMQAAGDALQKLTGKRVCRAGSQALAMAVEAGLKPQMAYTVAETARYTGVDRQTLYKERDAGRIQMVIPKGADKGARISVFEVDRWMEENVA